MPGIRTRTADQQLLVDRVSADAAVGYSVTEISVRLDKPVTSISRIAIKNGISIQRHLTDYESAIEAVRNGASYAEAAADAGLCASSLAAVARRRGVQSTARSGPRDGRIARAVDRVIAGASIREACDAERCSYPGVFVTLRRRGIR